MRPTSLALRGLKSWRDVEFPLFPLTAISGPNGSGKSAVLEAVRLALLGYEPGVGKQLQATRKLVNEELGAADIGLSFDTGFAIRRRFGTDTDTQVMPSRGESTGRACQERINIETGGLVVSLDLGEFLELSDEKRRAWLFEHLPSESAQLDWATFAKWTDAEGSTLGEVVQSLWTHSVVSAKNAVVGLSSAIEVAHRRFLEADRQRQAQAKVVLRSEEILRATPKPATPPDGELEEAHQRVAGLNQRIGEARAGREALEAVRARIQRARDELNRAERQAEHTRTVRDDLSLQLEAEGEVPDDGDRPARLKNLQGRLEGLHGSKAEATERVAAARARVHELRGREQEMDRHGACPYASLGCTTDTGAILSAVREQLRQDQVDAAARLEAEVQAESQVFELIKADTQERNAVQLELSALDTCRQNRKALAASVDAKNVLLKELEERAEIHRRDLAAAEREASALQEDDALTGLYRERDAAEAALRELTVAREQRVKYETLQEAHKRESEVLERREAEARELKELDGNLARLRAHVIQRMIDPLCQEADQILRSIDPAKSFRFIFEREPDRPTMDFGFEQDGVLRLYDAASKGERVMLAVAFLGAIISVVAPPMRLLVVDDAEQLDPVRRRRLMEALAAMSDRWDAVIIAGACRLEGPGWHQLQLGAVEELEYSAA